MYMITLVCVDIFLPDVAVQTTSNWIVVCLNIVHLVQEKPI